jgi:dTDP-3,4-didehydro-2,6-dideoxy-alpha-D-glucose 3-reductase
MRWGFAGIGRVTNRMVQAVRAAQEHSLEMVAGRDAAKLHDWSMQHQVSSTTTSFDKLIEAPGIEAIYIALPPSLHFDVASKAIANGKTVLCEKPFTDRFALAELLQRQSTSTGVPIYTATAFPFHPRSLAMRETIERGRLGQLSRIHVACTFSQVLNRGKDYRTDPTLGGGCLLDLGWYCVYATLWLTGLKPESIQAIGRKCPTTGIWLSCQALVRLESGVTAIWDCGFDAAGRKWIEISGTEASIICDDFLRPWDNAKPRFWLHGHDGKAQVEMVGVNCFQEVNLFSQIQPVHTEAAKKDLELAVQTMEILERWEIKMRS